MRVLAKAISGTHRAARPTQGDPETARRELEFGAPLTVDKRWSTTWSG